MAQGILAFVFEAAPQPMDLTARAGLTLVSETLLAPGLDEIVATWLPPARAASGAIASSTSSMPSCWSRPRVEGLYRAYARQQIRLQS